MSGNQNASKERKAIGASLIVLILGGVVILGIREMTGVKAGTAVSDTLVVSLLIIPVVIYTIISGKIEELRGPGGWGVKFTGLEVKVDKLETEFTGLGTNLTGLETKFTKGATEPVSAVSETIEPSVDEMDVVFKEGIRGLQERRRELNETQPIVMVMVPGRGKDYYNRQSVIEYIKNLSQYRNFKFIVFVDDNNQFVAYMPSWAIKGLLGLEKLGGEFINVINEGRLAALYRYPGVVRKAINIQYTNVEALREMTEQNLEALVVVDEKDHLKGVIEREQVLSRMMLALTK